MNSNFQPYSYPQRLQEDVDGISIKRISNLTYTWRVEMKEGEGIWKRITPLQRGGLENLEKNHCILKNCNFI